MIIQSMVHSFLTQLRLLRSIFWSLSIIAGLAISGMVCAASYSDGWAAYQASEYKSALDIWTPLANKNDGRAQIGIAVLYEKGLGTARNGTKAIYWYKQAANNGIAEAQHDLGIKYFTGQDVGRDYYKAAKLWQKAADKGLSPAQTKLAYLYLRGLGVPQNKKEAARLYLLAANVGNAEAQYNLGLLYARGEGIHTDMAEATRWLTESAAQGYARARHDLAMLYLTGQGVDPDYQMAADLLESAAKQGVAESQYHLGIMYLQGQGLKVDEKKGAQLIAQAAQQGYAMAQYDLAGLYENGRGVAKDPAKAAAWYRRHAEEQTRRARVAVASQPRQSPASANKQQKEQPAIREDSGQANILAPAASADRWLVLRDSNHYTIQLLANHSEKLMLKFINQFDPELGVRYIHYRLQGETWFAALMGDFPDRETAIKARDKLLEKYKDLKPWIRSFEDMRKLISKG